MGIGDRIKLLREEFNIERSELAKKINITYHALSKYETNERQPDYDTLDNIATFFDVSVDYLLGRSNIRNPYADTPPTNALDGLSPESKKELEKYIELLKIKDEVNKGKDEMSSTLKENA